MFSCSGIYPSIPKYSCASSCSAYSQPPATPELLLRAGCGVVYILNSLQGSWLLKSLFSLSGFEFLSLLWAVVKEGAAWGEWWKRRPICCEMQIRGNRRSLFASIPDVE